MKPQPVCMAAASFATRKGLAVRLQHAMLRVRGQAAD